MTFPVCLSVAVAAFGAPFVPSDHREAPVVQEDLTADVADLYAFLNPGDSSRLVLVMTVNGFTAPSENTTFNFSPNVRYSFRIDNTGDAQEDARIDLTFTPDLANQQFTADFSGAGTATGPVTLPTLEPAPNPPVITAGPLGSQIFAGPRDDPFFFDVVGFNRVLAGTGNFSGADGFAGYNVSAIVVEVPLSFATGGGPDSTPLQIWSTTERRSVTVRLNQTGEIVRQKGIFRQVDRVGNPGVNTALIPSSLKDVYNVVFPKDDSRFGPTIVGTLQALGTSQANIDVLASVAVPDTLKLDATQTIGYPNGRDLDDDVIDTLFFFIFNQSGVTDSVPANDRPFSNAFPYLADPFQP